MREGLDHAINSSFNKYVNQKKPVAITFQMKQGQNCHVILFCKIRQQKSQKNNRSNVAVYSFVYFSYVGFFSRNYQMFSVVEK
jgi:hypothetical protein